jgi:hypothetical protein
MSKRESRRRGKLAEAAVGLAMSPPGAQVVVLWTPPPRGFAGAVRAGLTDLSRREYADRLAAVERRLDDAGIPHERLVAPASAVIAALERSGLANTPENRSLVYVTMWAAMKETDNA